MMKQNIYEVIYNMYRDEPALLNSDNRLTWRIWLYELKSDRGYITEQEFYKVKSSASIRRTARQVRKDKGLKPSKAVQEFRNNIERMKGMQSYHGSINRR